MSTPLFRSVISYSELSIEQKKYAADPIRDPIKGREIRDQELFYSVIQLAKQKQCENALNELTTIKNFEIMAQGFYELAPHIENQEQLDKVVQAAKNTLNQGSRDKMTWGEMKKLPGLLATTLEVLGSVKERLIKEDILSF